ncbi:hypothetical protein [Saccharothrix coeruleofusca]|uniref:Uncharacterized protein n=1 Tax=Saccharothrix coeruleofusca TaxID=33919 RepID=A0A918AM48_9PSEU|nr:hypothetical protein [Saccharothrix coeruleofusca]GGP45019.1 hypothetical protein GCM10010185_16020 [Saccharothrix coeruleofusca]
MIEAFARRTAGLVLVALAAVVPVVAYTRLDAWDAELAGRADPSSIDLVEMLLGGIGVWVIIGTGLWWHRHRTTMWPIWARWATTPGLFLAVFICLSIASKKSAPIALAIGAGLIAACWALSEAVRLVMTCPITDGLIASRLEIPFRVRGLKARLCVRHDRLVLDSLTSRRKRSRDAVAVPWQALRFIELINVEQKTVCQVLVFSGLPQAHAREFDVPPGPALHIVGTARELLVPVTNEVGRAVLRAVEARSANVEVDEGQLSEDEWRRRSGVRRTNALTHVQRRAGVHYRTDYRPYRLIPVAGFLVMPLFALSGMTLSLITGSKEWQEQFYVVDGVVTPWNVAILAVASIGFLYVLHRLVVKSFLSFMEGQNYIEAYPEPPARAKAGTVPGSGKRKKKRSPGSTST